MLRTSRLKWTLIGFASLVFTVVAALFIAGGGRDWRLFAGLLLFGPGTLLGAWQVLRPGTLTLDREGFVVKGLRRGRFVRWSELAGFSVGMPARFTKMVYYDYRHDERPKLAAVGRSLSGHDAGLPDTYGLKAEELAAVMEAFRSRAERA